MTDDPQTWCRLNMLSFARVSFDVVRRPRRNNQDTHMDTVLAFLTNLAVDQAFVRVVRRVCGDHFPKFDVAMVKECGFEYTIEFVRISEKDAQVPSLSDSDGDDDDDRVVGQVLFSNHYVSENTTVLDGCFSSRDSLPRVFMCALLWLFNGGDGFEHAVHGITGWPVDIVDDAKMFYFLCRVTDLGAIFRANWERARSGRALPIRKRPIDE